MANMEKIHRAMLRYTIQTHSEPPQFVRCSAVGRTYTECMERASQEHRVPFEQRNTQYDERGFVTTHGRYVDSKEALNIARDMKQLKENDYTQTRLEPSNVDYWESVASVRGPAIGK